MFRCNFNSRHSEYCVFTEILLGESDVWVWLLPVRYIVARYWEQYWIPCLTELNRSDSQYLGFLTPTPTGVVIWKWLLQSYRCMCSSTLQGWQPSEYVYIIAILNLCIAMSYFILHWGFSQVYTVMSHRSNWLIQDSMHLWYFTKRWLSLYGSTMCIWIMTTNRIWLNDKHSSVLSFVKLLRTLW